MTPTGRDSSDGGGGFEERTPLCRDDLPTHPDRPELADTIRRAGGRASLAKVEHALEVLAGLDGRPVSMGELGRLVGVSRGRVVVAPLETQGLVSRTVHHSPTGRQTASSFSVTPAGWAYLDARQRAPSEDCKVGARVPTRPLGWFSNNHPSNQSLGARPGARNPADEAGAVDEPGWHAGEEVEEAVAAVLAAFAGAPGRVAGEANLVVLRGVVDDALARGCRPDRLVEAAAHDYTGSRSAPAVLVARIRSLSPTPPPDSSPPEAVAADLERVRVLARNWAGCVPCEEIVDEALKRLSGLTAEDVRTVVDEVLADVPG